MNDQLSIEGFVEPEPECRLCGGAKRVYDQAIDAYRMCECSYVKLPPPDTNPVAPAGIDGRADEVRLNRQQALVWAVLVDHDWHTLRELSERTGCPEASVSARIRDLRKRKYGSHTIERESLGSGLFRYRLLTDEVAA